MTAKRFRKCRVRLDRGKVVPVMKCSFGNAQHQKAGKTTDSLKNLSATKSKVIREGKERDPRGNWFPRLVGIEAGWVIRRVMEAILIIVLSALGQKSALT